MLCKLNQRISLQQRTIIQDENGFEFEKWITVATVWASISNLYGNEYFEAKKTTSEDMLKFKIRYRSDIDKSMRISHKGRNYNILHIDNIKFENKLIEIKASEVV